MATQPTQAADAKRDMIARMGLRPDERTAMFFDGANLYAASKMLGFEINYKELLSIVAGATKLIRANYYTAVLDDDNEHQSIRPLLDWLAYNGFQVVSKPAKEFVDSMGRRKVKGNMDIELAVDMLELAPRLDHIILFSGDGDMRAVIEAVQRKGVRASVVSSIVTQPAMVADELRRQCDNFVEMAAIAPAFQRVRDPDMARPRYAAAR